MPTFRWSYISCGGRKEWCGRHCLCGRILLSRVVLDLANDVQKGTQSLADVHVFRRVVQVFVYMACMTGRWSALDIADAQSMCVCDCCTSESEQRRLGLERVHILIL